MEETQVGVAAYGCPQCVESESHLQPAGAYFEMPAAQAESCCDHAEARCDPAETGCARDLACYDHAEACFDFAEACCDPAEGPCTGRCLDHGEVNFEHADPCFDSNALLFGREHVGQGQRQYGELACCWGLLQAALTLP